MEHPTTGPGVRAGRSIHPPDPPPPESQFAPVESHPLVFGTALALILGWMGLALIVPAIRHLIPYLAVAAAVVVACLWLHRAGRHRLAAGAFSLGLWLLTQLPPFVTGHIDVPGIMLPMISVLAAGLIWSTRGAMVLAALSIVVWAVALAAARQGLLIEPQPRTDIQFWFVFAESLVMVSVFLHVATSAHRSALTRARASAAQVERLMRVAPDGIVILDGTGTIVSANPAMARMAGTSVEELVGRGVVDSGLLSPASVAHVRQGFQAALSGTLDKPFEAELLRPDGSVAVVEALYHPVEWEGRTSLEVIIRDVTLRKQREQVEREVQQRESLIEKIDAVGHLAGGVAHDFNNLLTVVGAAAELIEENPGSEKSVRELIGEIRRAQQHAALLTRRLLAFGQRQVMELRPLDLGSAVGERTDLLRGLLRENVSLALDLRGGDTTVMADPVMVEQLLINLATNAVEAMPDGGTLKLTVDVVEPAQPVVGYAGIADPGRYVTLVVADNGSGIAAEALPRIFDPFFSTRRAHGGSGLGLSAVLGMVRRAGGQVQVRSQVGEGTTVTLFFPSVKAVPHSDGAAVPAGTRRG